MFHTIRVTNLATIFAFYVSTNAIANELDTYVDSIVSLSMGKGSKSYVHTSSVINSSVRGSTALSVKGETYINISSGGSRGHISIATIENSSVGKASISVSTDDIINISGGNGKNCTTDIGTVKNVMIGSIRQKIHIGGKIINLSIGAKGVNTPCEIRIGAIGKW